jgi:NAD(P)-dependent dehydrogenase (short-subunit alcohol dehydrogenase family)
MLEIDRTSGSTVDFSVALVWAQAWHDGAAATEYTMKTKHKAALWLGAGSVAWAAGRQWARRVRSIELESKVVLVTGGSRGLGLELARQLASSPPRGDGARVAICARDEDELKRAKLQLLGQGAEVETFVCDIGDQAQCEKLVADVEARLGPIDVLINNAAHMQIGPVELMTMADYEETMRAHFWGPLYLIYASLPSMRERHSGRIVNISSFVSKLVPPHMTPYTASKHALAGLSNGLRVELAKDGIFVTAIYPTLMRTGSLYHVLFKGDNKTEYALGAVIHSSPLFTMSAPRAAREIIDCCKRGDAEAVLSRRAQIATAFGVLFPGVTADVFALLTRVLPDGRQPGDAHEPMRGMESFSSIAPSRLTALGDEAARQFNETWPGPEK